MLLTAAAVAVVFGFLGAFAAVKVFADDLRGPQGATGIQGAPGDPGPRGMDGTDGARGERGPEGPPGKRGKAAPTPKPPALAVNSASCAGAPVQVVTDVKSVQGKVQISKSYICFPE